MKTSTLFRAYLLSNESADEYYFSARQQPYIYADVIAKLLRQGNKHKHRAVKLKRRILARLEARND